VLELGVQEHIDYRSQRFEEVVSNVDMVLDTVGGKHIEPSLKVLKEGGTLISIPTAIPAELVEQAKAKNERAFFYLVHSSGEDMKALADLLEAGIIRPYVNHYDFSQMAIAHQQMETGSNKGKIVLTIA